MPAERLTIKRTPTGYWVLNRGAVPVGGAVTRDAAERERELRRRLRHRRLRRAPGTTARSR